MSTDQTTLSEALGLTNGVELFRHAVSLTLSESNCSDILNKLICSELNTKEMMFCAFICGKLQEAEKELNEVIVKMILAEKMNELLK